MTKYDIESNLSSIDVWSSSFVRSLSLSLPNSRPFLPSFLLSSSSPSFFSYHSYSYGISSVSVSHTVSIFLSSYVGRESMSFLLLTFQLLPLLACVCVWLSIEHHVFLAHFRAREWEWEKRPLSLKSSASIYISLLLLLLLSQYTNEGVIYYPRHHHHQRFCKAQFNNNNSGSGAPES